MERQLEISHCPFVCRVQAAFFTFACLALGLSAVPVLKRDGGP